MHTVVGLQLVFEAKFLATAITFVGLLAGMDALVALQRALIAEAAPAELALVRVVTCHAETVQNLSFHGLKNTESVEK